MGKRVFFKKDYQKKFIGNVKEISGLTWKDLCLKLNLKYTTLSKSYFFEYCSLPLPVFGELCKLVGLNRNSVIKKYHAEIKDEIVIIGRKVLGESRKNLKEIKILFTRTELDLDISKVRFSKGDVEKGIKLPVKLNKDLAEEIGMHFGDGFLSSRRYDYRLKGNPFDEKEYYFNYIKPLFKRIYNVNLILKESWKSFGFEIYSKAIWDFKTRVLGIKPGKKYDLSIPDILKVKNVEILSSFLRGLFDTDGHLSFKSNYGYEKYYPVIEISLTSKKLIGEVAEILKMLGFNLWVGFNERYGRISISGLKNFRRYRKLIGWSSQKNLNRVVEWEKQYPLLK